MKQGRKPMNLQDLVTEGQRLLALNPAMATMTIYSGETGLVKAVEPFYGKLMAGKVVQHSVYRDSLEVDLSADDDEANGVIIG